MTTKTENNILTVFTDDRIDINNADAVEKYIRDEKAASGAASVIVDAEKLVYISSAGLRVILRLRKEDPSLKVINVSADVYEIFEMTGFSELITIEKAFRQFSIEGCEVIGMGAKGTVYRYNQDTIVKVYNNPDSIADIKRERELARKAFVLGVPTAISYDVVKVGEKFGSVFELLDAKCFSRLIKENPGDTEKYAEEAAKLLKLIHTTKVSEGDMVDMKKTVYRWLSDDEKYFTPEQNSALRKLVDEVPDDMTMIHGDFHTNNIMMQNGETLLIDMDTLAHGNPILELANVYSCYVCFAEFDPEREKAFFDLEIPQLNTFWKYFIRFYLGSEDEALIKETEKKARILSLIRFIRHTAKRSGDQSKITADINSARDQIVALLDSVKTLSI